MEMKKEIGDLAIFGGPKSFDNKLHVGRPNIGNRERLLNRINDILDNRWLTNDGPYVQELERRIAEFVGVKHCISVCNATIGLEIAIRALDLSGEVIVPSMTFIATAHSLEWQKTKPVFCDVDPDTWNIDPKKVEDMITPRTTGIIGVHLFGRPCEADLLQAIASKNNLKLMFDAAHAFGCSNNNKMVGNFGDVEVFSFHATKFFNSLEGGAIVTNNDEIAEKVRLMRNFGFKDYDVLTVGTNGKMNEFSAAMGITSLESVNDFISRNKHNYEKYRENLSGIPGVKLIKYDERERCNFQYLVLDIDEGATKISRDNLMKILWAENVMARNYFHPGCHKANPYVAGLDGKGWNLPVTEKISRRLLSLPTGTGMNDQDIEKLCEIIRFCVKKGGEISANMEDKK